MIPAYLFYNTAMYSGPHVRVPVIGTRGLISSHAMFKTPILPVVNPEFFFLLLSFFLMYET